MLSLRSDGPGDASWATSIGGDLVVSTSSSASYGRRPRLPEIALLTALLEDALHCVQGWVLGASHDQYREAREWFASDRRDWPFSFLNICDHLEIDAAALRRRLGAAQAVEESVQV